MLVEGECEEKTTYRFIGGFRNKLSRLSDFVDDGEDVWKQDDQG